MKTLCAWCRRYGREPKLIKGRPDDPEITHGCCAECEAALIEEERTEIVRACEASA